MEAALSLLNFASQGVKSNFWGLACPAYCGPFPLSSFLLSYLLGLISGLCLCGFLALHLQAPLATAQGSDPRPCSRIEQYLHERQLISRRRR